MTAKKVLTVVGARPQFVKAAAVSRALAGQSRLQEVMVHTGQHFDENMSEVFFRELAIREPDYNLGIHGGSHGDMTGRMLAALERILLDEHPDAVLVYGDTNSTLAGALAAAKLNIPLAHVEAGLRSFNRRMPEEINRVLTDHVSSLLFCPTTASVDNLGREGIVDGVHLVGDVMYDATLHARGRALESSRIVAALGLDGVAYTFATVHRAENTEDRDRLAEIAAYLESLAETQEVVMPLHPRTRAALHHAGIAFARVRVIDPLGYIDTQRLLASARQVVTDSGGLQKEAYFHGVPCVTLREETEWVETVAHGWNRLWRVPSYAAPRRPIDDYGRGDAAQAVASMLEAFLTT